MTPRVTIGIDPGKEGSMAVIVGGTDLVMCTRLPFSQSPISRNRTLMAGVLQQFIAPFAAPVATGDVDSIYEQCRQLDAVIAETDDLVLEDIVEHTDALLVTMSRLLPQALGGWERRAAIATIEVPGVRPKESPRTALVAGANYGVVIGLLQAAGIRTETIDNSAWQQAVGCDRVPAPKKKPGEADDAFSRRKREADRERKDARIRRVHTLFPGRASALVGNDHNKADAVLLAYHGHLVLAAEVEGLAV